LKRITTLILAAVLLAVATAGSLRASSDEAGVRKILDQFVETWNRQDVDAFAALFVQDIQMVILNAQIWKGREDVHAHLSFLFDKDTPEAAKLGLPPQARGAFRTVTYRFDDVDLRFIHKDVAVAIVHWTQMGDPRFKDKPRTGVITFVANREGNGWIFSAFQNTARQ
jgi:hypothetical protein